ncbi:MAG: thioredoxin domain-containing protein [Cyanobacteria bacterium P01_F01_bin.3]
MMTTVTDENFMQEVLASSAPVIVHFQAPWCGICRLITPVLNSFQLEWPGSIRVLDVNADENLKLANQYQLQTLPTLLYMEQGQVIHRIEGFRSRETLRSRLNDIAGRHRLESTFSKSA